MPASPSSLIASLSAAPAGLGPPELAVGLPAALAAVPDPRARRGIRHRLSVVLTAAVCAVVAGYRSYTAIAEWVADLPAGTAALLGIDADRRPSEAMIRRLLQAVDPDLLAAAIGTWLTARIPTPAPGHRRAIAVDGKALRGSQDRACLGGQELLPGRPATSWCRINIGLVEDLPDGAGRDAVAEADQFTLDPAVPARRVLRCYSQHQVVDLLGDWWPPGSRMRVRPMPGDQLAVPAEQCRGGDEERRSLRAGQ